MALIKMGMGVAEMSGKVGAHVCSHNQGGPYLRLKGAVTNPRTPEQQTVRDAFQLLADIWVNTLTDLQRAGWKTYSDNVPLANRIGDLRSIGALAQYQRSNVIRLQAGLSRIDDSPVVFDLGDFTAPVVQAVGATTLLNGTVTVLGGQLDTWNTGSNGALLVFQSRPQNPSINFFKGPFQLQGVHAGSSPTNSASFTTNSNPFPTPSGTREFFQFRGLSPDGRLSALSNAQFDI